MVSVCDDQGDVAESDHSNADEQESRIAETNSKEGVGRVKGGNENNEIQRLASSQIFKIIPLLYF